MSLLPSAESNLRRATAPVCGENWNTPSAASPSLFSSTVQSPTLPTWERNTKGASGVSLEKNQS